ncbi:MAG: hypothetical protein V3T31_07585 [candidate division Zixibacteria bacterium]
MQKIGRYILTHKLGQSTNGQTWKSYDSALGCEAVVKLVHDRSLLSLDNQRQFLNNQKLLTRCAPDLIVSFKEITVAEGQLILTRDFVSGLSLTDQIKSGLWQIADHDSYDRFLTLMQKLARFLNRCSENLLTASNLKVENIIMKPDGEFSLLDIGLINQNRQSNESQNDIFSLGLLCQTMLTWSSDGKEQTLPPDARLLLSRMLATSPTDRIEPPELLATLEEMRSFHKRQPAVETENIRPGGSRRYLTLSLLAVLLVIFWWVITTIDR